MAQFFQVPGEGEPIGEAPIALDIDPDTAEQQRYETYGEGYEVTTLPPLDEAGRDKLRAEINMLGGIGTKSRVIINNEAPAAGTSIFVEGREVPLGLGTEYRTYRRSHGQHY